MALPAPPPFSQAEKRIVTKLAAKKSEVLSKPCSPARSNNDTFIITDDRPLVYYCFAATITIKRFLYLLLTFT